MALTKKIRSLLSQRDATTKSVRVEAPEQPKSDVKIDVYRDSEKPKGGFREIATLTVNGHPFELRDIETYFIRKAKEMGADAVRFISPVKNLEAPAGWRIFDTFRCLASIIVYEKSEAEGL